MLKQRIRIHFPPRQTSSVSTNVQRATESRPVRNFRYYG